MACRARSSSPTSRCFPDLAEKLLEFIEDSPLVAHNAGFDFGFLNHELEPLRAKPSVCTSRMVDTLTIARSRHPGAKHSLDALCMRFGIDRSHRVKHGALLDAQLLAQVYVELTGGRQIGLGLVADTEPLDASTATASPFAFVNAASRGLTPLSSRNSIATARLLRSSSTRSGRVSLEPRLTGLRRRS